MEFENLLKELTKTNTSRDSSRDLSKGVTDLVETPIVSMQIRVDTNGDTNFSISRTEAAQLHTVGRQIAIHHLLASKAREELSDYLKPQYVRYAEANPGFRGILVKTDDEEWTILITPVRKTVISEKLLQEKLGSLFNQIVKRQHKIVLDFDEFVMTRDGTILKANEIFELQKKALVDTGVYPVEVEAMLTLASSYTIDEKRWDSLAKKGLVPPGNDDDYTEFNSWRLNVDVNKFSFDSY